MARISTIATVSALVLFAGSAFAAPVDLSAWVAEGGGNWNVAVPPNSVNQTINGRPAVFHNNTNSQGTALSGSIKVGNNWDNDFVGFVLGYDAGELASATSDFWLIDWKQGNQGTASRGLALSHVTGNSAENDFWAHNGAVDEVQRAANLGDTGWVDGTEYTFDLTFTDSLIEVFVNGTLELSLAGVFGDGGFGFYNYSQHDVTYAGIEDRVLPSPVPLPAGMPILLLALSALGVAARRRKA